jgi:hypothetical protein
MKQIADREESLAPQAKQPGFDCNTMQYGRSHYVLVSHLSEMWGLDCGETASQNGRDAGEVSRHLPRARVREGICLELSETRVFDLPLLLFERRHFFRSELS